MCAVSSIEPPSAFTVATSRSFAVLVCNASGTAGVVNLVVGLNGQNTTFNGTLTDNYGLKGNLTKTGAGILTLSGNNAKTIAALTENLGTNANLTFTAKNGVIGAIANNLSVVFVAPTGPTASETYALTGNTLTVGLAGPSAGVVNSTAATILNAINGNIALNTTFTVSNTTGTGSNGSGTVAVFTGTLAGQYGYNGTTTITSGTFGNFSGIAGNQTTGGFINFNSLNNFGTTPNITLSNGGLQFAAGYTGGDVSGVFNSNGGLGAGVDTLDVNNNNIVLGTPLAGTGELVVAGNGTLTLVGASTYTGGTAVNHDATRLYLGSGGTSAGNAGSVTGNILDNSGVAFNEPTRVTTR